MNVPLALSALVILSGCAGMNQAVTVVPNTMDDLAAKTEGFRRGRELGPPARVEPPAPGL